MFKRDTQRGWSQGASNVKSPFFSVARSSGSPQPMTRVKPPGPPTTRGAIED